MNKSIGIDVGGTKVLGGVVDEFGNILSSHRLETPSEGGLALVESIVQVAKVLSEDHDVKSVGISAAGFISSDRKTILATPNIKNWNGLNLHAQISGRIESDVVIENDANAAAWGEYRFGAGRGYKDLIMLTLGTGVGGGLVIDNQLFRGSFGIAGELGHIRLIPDGIKCGCGSYGCLEQYASGTALVRTIREEISRNPQEGKELLDKIGATSQTLTGTMVTEAASMNDPIALKGFTTLAEHLGAGIASLSSVLDPELVVIGGGVIDAGEILIDRTLDAMTRVIPFSGKRPLPKIVSAQLGNSAGLIGAADLARN